MNLTDLFVTLRLDTSKFEKGISEAKSKLKGFSNIGNGVSKFGTSLKQLGSKISSLGATASVVTAGVTAVLGASFNKAKSFIGTYESAMTVFTRKLKGGKQAGIEMYNSLVKIAKGSAYAQEHMVEAGKVLVAMGVSADDTKKYVQAATDAISGFGGTGTDVEHMAQMFAKISQQTNMYTVDLNTMVKAGIPAWDILATKYHTTTDKVKEMAKEGLLPATESLNTITDALEESDSSSEMFKYSVAGLAKELKSGTLTGTLDSLNTSFRSFSLSLLDLDPRTESGEKNIKKLNAAIAAFGKTLEKIGKKFSFVGKWAGDALENTKEFLDNLNEKLEDTPQDKLEKIAKSILSIAAAGPILLVTGKIVSSIGSGFEMLGSIVSGASESFAALSGACGGVGIGLGVVAAAAGAAVAVFIFLKEYWDKVVDAFNQWVENTGIKDKIAQLKKHIEELGPKVGKLKDFFIAWGGVLVAELTPAIAIVMGMINGLVGAFDGLIKVIEGVIDFLSGFGEIIVGIFSGDKEKIQQGLNDMGNGILEIFKGIGETIWNYFSNYITGVWEFAKSIINVTGVGEWISGIWNGVLEWLNNIKNSIHDWWLNLLNTAKEKGEQIKTAITTPVIDTYNSVVSWLDKTKNKILDTFNNIKNKTVEIWDNIKNSITEKIEAAKTAVGNIIDKIKGFFNFNISWPHIPVPKFSISPSGWKIGDLLQGSIPSLDIKWNAKGGIFTKPTLFNTPSGLQGVGEAGAEAILPIKVLKAYIAEAMSEVLQEANVSYKNSANGKSTSAMVNGMISAINDNNQNINVYIGGKKIASEIYQPLMNIMKNKEVYVGA